MNIGKNIAIIQTQYLRDESLSLAAKGLLAWMMTSRDRNFSTAELMARHAIGIAGLRTLLKELERAGYLTRTRKRGDFGRFDYDWKVTPRRRQ